MRIEGLLFPTLIAIITAALFVYSLETNNVLAAYVVVAVGAGILATLHMAGDVETDERDIRNAGRAALATIKTMITLGIVIGVWLTAAGHAGGEFVALFSALCALLWFLLYTYYSWREVV